MSRGSWIENRAFLFRSQLFFSQSSQGCFTTTPGRYQTAVPLAGDLMFSCAHFVRRICFRFAIQPPADLASVEARFDDYRQTALRVRPSGSVSIRSHFDEVEPRRISVSV
jgi:hypothetical protein